MNDLIDPKEIEVTGKDGVKRKFIISKMPYADGGREVVTQFMPTAMPKVGNYEQNEKLMLKMMSFVAVVTAGGPIRLTTRELVNNHIPDFLTGATIEKDMLEHNFGFFDTGKISAYLQDLGQKHLGSILPILTRLLAQFSQNGAPPSGS